MTRLLSTLAVFFFVIAFHVAPAASQEDDRETSWFVGTWSIHVEDWLFATRHEKNVRGTAFVTYDAAAGFEVHVRLEDPLTGRHYELEGSGIDVTAKGVTLNLYGQSATVSATFDGKKDVREWAPDPTDRDAPGLFVRAVSPRTRIKAWVETGDAEVELVVDPDSRFPEVAEVHLALQRREHELVGEWSYPNGESGMYGRRSARQEAIPELGIPEAQLGKRIWGRERWTMRDKGAIRSVTEIPSRRTPEPAEGERLPSVTTVLRVEGWDLPTTARQLGQSVAFEDPLIDFVSFEAARAADPLDARPRRPGTLDIKVRLDAGVEAGPKLLHVVGMSAVWELRFPDVMPELTIYGYVGPKTVRQVYVLTHGQVFYVQCKLEGELHFSHRLMGVSIGGQARITVPIARQPGDKNIYRSETMTLIDPTRPPTADDEGLAIAAPSGSYLVFLSGDTVTEVEWGSIDVLDSAALKEPKILVQPAGLFSSNASIDTVAKDEPFTVRLRVPGPPEQDALKVRFVVKGKDDAAEIDVFSLGGREDAEVSYYMPSGDLSIARGESDAFLGLLPLDLVDTEDGDEVEVSYGTAHATFQVYDTQLKKRLGIRKQQLSLLRTALEQLSAAEAMGEAGRAVARIRLKLVDHVFKLIAREEFTDLHRVILLETYLSLVQESLGLHDLERGYRHRRYGFQLISAREGEAIAWAIHKETKRLMRRAFLEFGEGVSVGLVMWIGETTGVGGLYTAVSGYDLFGRRVNFLERVMSGVDAFFRMQQLAILGSTEGAFVGKWAQGVKARRAKAASSNAAGMGLSKSFPGHRKAWRKAKRPVGRSNIVRQILPDDCGVGAVLTIAKNRLKKLKTTVADMMNWSAMKGKGYKPGRGTTAQGMVEMIEHQGLRARHVAHPSALKKFDVEEMSHFVTKGKTSFREHNIDFLARARRRGDDVIVALHPRHTGYKGKGAHWVTVEAVVEKGTTGAVIVGDPVTGKFWKMQRSDFRKHWNRELGTLLITDP